MSNLRWSGRNHIGCVIASSLAGAKQSPVAARRVLRLRGSQWHRCSLGRVSARPPQAGVYFDFGFGLAFLVAFGLTSLTALALYSGILAIGSRA